MTTVALVAHDGKKDAMLAWVATHKRDLLRYELLATRTTGERIVSAHGLPIKGLKSGAHGGDVQLGALIAEGRLGALIFFVDPLAVLPHQTDVTSLLRLAILYNVLLAVNAASADAVLTMLRTRCAEPVL
ncbi:methylglyoxal synthase [Falsiroseomonas sp.]|uniref:methylglyoxal synthase n=1 Tax=Falsiroseomonas sp. TaxID=2870721 RepID=UPI0034A48580